MERQDIQTKELAHALLAKSDCVKKRFVTIIRNRLRRAAGENMTYRELVDGFYLSPEVESLAGCIPKFTQEEINSDPRLAYILRKHG